MIRDVKEIQKITRTYFKIYIPPNWNPKRNGWNSRNIQPTKVNSRWSNLDRSITIPFLVT